MFVEHSPRVGHCTPELVAKAEETPHPSFRVRAGRVCAGESSTCAGEVPRQEAGFLSLGEAPPHVLAAQGGLRDAGRDGQARFSGGDRIGAGCYVMGTIWRHRGEWVKAPEENSPGASRKGDQRG